jgi:formylglycine-generating enzyme required for sulfatase activity
VTRAGFAELERVQAAVVDGTPHITFWREALGPARADAIRGEFPHAEMPVQSASWCMADLYLQYAGDPSQETWALGCTRLRGHEGQHVAHDRPGYPVAAWTVEASRDSQREGDRDSESPGPAPSPRATR